MTPRRRLRGETVPFRLELENGVHDLAVSLMYDETLSLHEVVFVTRGKIGQGLDHLLTDLGIKLSRAIQGRDPNTGEASEGVTIVTPESAAP